MSTQEAPKYQLPEGDIGWGHPHILTPKQAKSLMVRLRLFDVVGEVTERQAIETVFQEELTSGFETFDTLKSPIYTASKVGLKKIERAVTTVTQLRGDVAAVVFPLSPEEIARLDISPDRTPASFTLYERLNERFAGKTYKDVAEGLEARKKQKKASIPPPTEPTRVVSQPQFVEPTPPSVAQTTPRSRIVEIYRAPQKTAITEEVQREMILLMQTAGSLLAGSPQDQIADLAALVLQFESGVLTAPNNLEFLATHNYEAKRQMATRALQSTIVSLLKQEAVSRSQWKTGRAINDLSFFLGKTHGELIVREALLGLPDVQVRVLSESMSTHMKSELGYPDIDWCDGTQMKEYIVQASSFKPPSEILDPSSFETEFIPDENVERLSILLEACTGRAAQGFDTGGVIETIIKERGEEEASSLFTRMVKIARKGDSLEDLAYFFQQHRATTLLARKCARLLIKGR